MNWDATGAVGEIVSAFADSSDRNKLIDSVAYQVGIDDVRVTLKECPGLKLPFAYLVQE